MNDNIESHSLYNGKIKLTFDPKLHTYKVDNNVVYGVTSIIGVLNKPALMYWAVNQAVEFLEKAWKVGKSYDEIEKHNLLESAKSAHRKKKQEAADVGQLFHQWADKYVQAKINDTQIPDMPINPSLLSTVQAFLKWESENKIKWLTSEQKIFSIANNYAGTLDAEAIVNGELSVIDYKTSSGIYDEYFYQTAAYIKAREEEAPKSLLNYLLSRFGIKNYTYKKAWILRVSKQGGDFDKGFSDKIEKDFAVFLACKTIYERQMEKKREAFNLKNGGNNGK